MDDDHATSDESGAPTDHAHDAPRGYADESHALPGGLTVAANGLGLEVPTTRLEPGDPTEWSYRIRDDGGSVVTEFEETHDQLAHLILVRRDLTHFQHLHPTLGEGGTWTSTVTIPDPGVYRAFVDVLVGRQPTTLGVDLFASGSARYEAPPGSTREATAAGYTIRMAPETIPAGERVTVEFAVRSGDDLVALDPYLGALGHLVALRDGDLAYLHVHPEATDPGDGVVRFAVRFPTAGRYRLFFQAKPRGELLTVAFDVRAGER